MIVVIVVGFICFWVAAAMNYNLVWKNEISLGLNTLKYNPREYKIYNNMGVEYYNLGGGHGSYKTSKDQLRAKTIKLYKLKSLGHKYIL